MRLLIFFLLAIQCLDAAWHIEKNSVYNTDTRLEWQDTVDNVTKEKKWHESDTYCKNLGLNQHYDWRLPTRKELLGILKVSQDPKVFRYATQDSYWSIDEDGSIVNAYQVYFGNGHISTWDKCETLHVRCVRYH